MKRIKNIATIVALGIGLLVSSCAGNKQVPSPYQTQMDASLNSLLAVRNDSTGIWPDAGWWNSANVLTAVIRYADLTDQREKFLPILQDVFTKTKKFTWYTDKGAVGGVCQNFINDYYDDEGWWALAWIEAYKLTQQTEYLDMAETIFADMTTGWSDDVSNGGIFWKKSPWVYKNSIANNLFALTAIRLYQQTKKSAYADWFEKEVSWYLNSGMYNKENNMIEDGLDDKTGEPNRGGYYTYNQGVAIAVLTEMYLYKQEKTYLELAENLVQGALKNMTTEEGILRERNTDIAAGNDGVQFKGIFMRHLGFLYNVTKNQTYSDFILKNADCIIKNNYDATSKSFGCYWYGPFKAVKTAANSSALECILEAEAISRAAKQ